ncbi:hypothetical protein [Bosea sp. BIWAKO-01]|uniref:hypothetical protein n=1 Tax=Bosea sp. BIWAKO-01 TaxID=506668 RepID=UPI000853197E|nr:hypothetical protein [Bosea sp. BIWAKO-01]GAU82891.1 hypothetical protein BIWAKO_02814 [Bosea sp. BIWAKO-01]
MFAFVRAAPIKNASYLTAMSRHARRLDGRSEIRCDAVAGAALVWRPPTASHFDDARDYRSNLRLHLHEHGAHIRKSAALGLHLLVGVTPAWVEEMGSLHAMDNPRNVALFDEARAWVEAWAGANSVFGARLDLDEAGGAVADIFCAPLFEEAHKSGRRRLCVSIRKALDGLQVAHDTTKSYVALQSSWHAWAERTLDPRLRRGEPALQTKRRHLSVKAFKEKMKAQDLEAGVGEPCGFRT